MSETRTDIACQALNLLLLLLARPDEGDAKRAERQSAVAAAEQGLLSEMLAHVAFSRAEAFSYAPIACRERAMRVVGALVEEHPTNQYNVGEVSLPACLARAGKWVLALRSVGSNVYCVR